MEMNSPVSFQVEAPIPAKKNSRIVLRGGRNIPSEAYRKWHDSQIGMLESLRKRHGAFTCPVAVSVGVAFGDRRRRDLDNALSSVLDLVKDSGLISDDDWGHVPRMTCEVLDTRAHYALVTVAPFRLPGAPKSVH